MVPGKYVVSRVAVCPQVFSSGGTCTLLPSFLGVHPNLWGCNVASNSSFGGTKKMNCIFSTQGVFTVTCQKNLGSVSPDSFFFLLSAKPEIVVPGSGISFSKFLVKWRIMQFFYLLCSQFRQKASSWINKTLLLVKQQKWLFN